jgi:hypothetical protein
MSVLTIFIVTSTGFIDMYYDAYVTGTGTPVLLWYRCCFFYGNTIPNHSHAVFPLAPNQIH